MCRPEEMASWLGTERVAGFPGVSLRAAGQQSFDRAADVNRVGSPSASSIHSAIVNAHQSCMVYICIVWCETS